MSNLNERRRKVVSNGVGLITPIVAKSAKGAFICDEQGNEYLDFASGIGVVSSGHCPEPVVNAIINQAQNLIHPCFMVTSYEPYVELCEKLADLFPHGDNTKVMLTNTGAESVENAVKIARQYTKRQAVIAFSEGFHGRTYMAMTLTSKVGYKLNCGPFVPEVYQLPYPNYYKYNDGLDMEAFIDREIQRLQHTFQSVVTADNVAAVIIELVQGEGGFNVAPKRYVEELRKVCDQHGIVLIFDEVQSGFGRTGKWSAYQHFGVTPDLSTWAKAMGSGLPIGAVIGKQEIMDAPVPGTLGGTYIGNPVACAAAIATIDYMKEQKLIERGAEIGEIIRNRLSELKEKCPAIGEVRGLGAMVAFELVKDGNASSPDSALTQALMEACWHRNLIIIPAGTYKNVVRLLVPLVITNEDLYRGLSVIEEELLRLG